MTDLPYTLEQPLDMEDARSATRVLAEQREAARRTYEEALVVASDTKLTYRKALSMAHVSAQGDTAAARKADAEYRAADAEKARDLADAMVKVAAVKLEALDGQRASLHRLIEWSMKLDPFAREDRSPVKFKAT